MAISPDQNVSGFDMADRLAKVFDNQNTKMSEMLSAHQNALTAISQRLLGGTEQQDPTRSRAMGGMVTAASLGNPSVLRQVTGGATPAALAGQPSLSPGPNQLRLVGSQDGSGPGGPGGPGGGPPPGSSNGAPAGAPSSIPAPASPQGPNAGIVNRLWGRAKSKIPGLQAVEDFRGEYLSQLNKNSFYTSTGTTQGEAFAERGREELSRLRHLGTFSEGESRQLFKTASSTGFTGDSAISRNDYIDFAARNKAQFGGSVNESNAFAQVAATNADTNLSKLSDTLTQLGQAARQAGTSAEAARRNFLEYYQGAESAVGTYASGTANVQASGQALLGKTMANVNMGATNTSSAYRYMVAGQNGMTIQGFNSLQAKDPAKAQGMIDQLGQQTVDQYVRGADPQAYAAMQKRISENKQNLTDPDFSRQLASDWWANDVKSLNPDAFLGIANTFYGTQFKDYTQATQKWIQSMVGQTASAAAKQAEGQLGSRSDVAGLKGIPGTKGLTAKPGSAEAMVSGALGKWDRATAGGAANAFMDEYKEKGSYSGAMAGLLKKMGHDKQDDPKVMIYTKEGPRVMKVSEAIKGGFESEITSGRAKFVDGKYKGKNVEALGLGADVTANSDAEAATHRSAKGAGVSQKAWDKKHPHDKSASWQVGDSKGGKVTLELTPAARRLLQPKGFSEDAEGVPRKNWLSKTGDFIHSVLPGPL